MPNENMMHFIDETPNPYYCVRNLKRFLIEYGFQELYEGDNWNLKEDGRYFVIKNDSSIIAFKMCPNKKAGFNIVLAHDDSPTFTIKPNPELKQNNYLKLNVYEYGGAIIYSWFDRPLSISGRVVVCKDNVYEKKLINIDKDLLVIPSQAAHIKKDTEFNIQNDMLPILSLNNNQKLEDVILENLDGDYAKVCDYDLNLYNREKGKIVGLNNEFIVSPRLDDLSDVYLASRSFVNSYNENAINVLCVFNNEEIGSETLQGASSTFMRDTFNKIAQVSGRDLIETFNNSFCISADNAHALHPNAANKSDLSNKVLMNEGLVVKHHIHYTTDGVSGAIFKGICEKANVPYQDFACKSDMRCGATVGVVNICNIPVHTVDVGLPQLAMHSAVETIGTKDSKYMLNAFTTFYESAIVKEKEKVKVLY